MMVSEWAGTIGAIGVLLAVWWPIRLAIALRAERRFDEQYRRNTDGVILGAEAIEVRGARAGAVLLLHGFNDSPRAVSSLAGALHDFGWTVHVPLLPGHGRTLQEFSRSGARQWIEAARAEYRRLRADHEAVAVGGMSMGGALAVVLAAEQRDVKAVFAIAPYLATSVPLRILLTLSPLAELGAKYMSSGGGRSVHDVDAASKMIAYRMATPRLVRELAKVASRAFDALPHIHQPILIMQSVEDNRISVRSARRAIKRLRSRDATVDWVKGAGHVLTVDFGYELRQQRIVDWLAQRM